MSLLTPGDLQYIKYCHREVLVFENIVKIQKVQIMNTPHT